MQFLISIFLTRLLTPEDFGKVGLVMVIIALLSFVQEGGLSQVFIQGSKTAEDFNLLFTINLGVAVCLFILLNVLAAPIAWFYGFPELQYVIHGLSVVMIIDSLTISHDVHLRKTMSFKWLGYSSLISTLVGGIIGIVMALMGLGVWSLVGQIFGTSLATFYTKWYGSRLRLKLDLNISEIKKLLSSSRGFFLSSFFLKINERLDVFFVGKFISASYLGYYTRAKTFKNLIILNSASTISTVLFPLLSNLQDDEKRYFKYLSFSYDFLVLFCVGLTSFLFFGSEIIFAQLFGEKWLPSAEIFNFLCIVGFFTSVSRIYYNILRSKGKGGIVARINFVEVTLNAISFFVWLLGKFEISILLYLLILNSAVSYIIYFVVVNFQIRWNIWEQLKPMITHPISFVVINFLSIKFCSFFYWPQWMHLVIFLMLGCIYVFLIRLDNIKKLLLIMKNRGSYAS